MITILAVGKKHESWLASAVERYEKQLKKPFAIQWVLVKNTSQKGDTAREIESEQLLGKLKETDFVVLLDERGDMYSSPALSHRLVHQLEQSRHIVMVIGGAYGVSDALHARADMIWSLSPLVFPHQIVRLMLVEQLYRAQSIHLGLPYHNE